MVLTDTILHSLHCINKAAIAFLLKASATDECKTHLCFEFISHAIFAHFISIFM